MIRIHTDRQIYSDIEQEIDAIRDRHYEQTKHMTIEEHVAWVNARTEHTMERLRARPDYQEILARV
jgi:hypothetical protein